MSPANVPFTLSIDYGDGTTLSVPQHTYLHAGTYTVTLAGGLNTIYHYGRPDPDPASAACLTAVNAFDLASLNDFSYAFHNCTHLSQVPSTFPPTITNCSAMFSGCSIFNQDLSGWDVSLVTTMSEMFNNSGLSTVYYSNILIGWAMLPLLQPGVILDAPQTHYYSYAQPYRDMLTIDRGWQIQDAGTVLQELTLTYNPAVPVYLNEAVEWLPVIQPEGVSFTYFTVTPSLPSSLTLDIFTGVISGVPTKLITASFTVTCFLVLGGGNINALSRVRMRTITVGPEVTGTFVIDAQCRHPFTLCPPPIIPKPNMWFNGNTNVPTVQKTDAFRYSWLVTNRINGYVVYLNNPPALTSGPQPPRNSF